MATRPSETKWKKENTTYVGIRFYNKPDADVLEYLSKFESKQAEIKRLIRKAIAEEQSK